MTPSGIIMNLVHFCTWQMSEIKYFYFNPKRIGLQVKPGCCAALQIRSFLDCLPSALLSLFTEIVFKMFSLWFNSGLFNYIIQEGHILRKILGLGPCISFSNSSHFINDNTLPCF